MITPDLNEPSSAARAAVNRIHEILMDEYDVVTWHHHAKFAQIIDEETNREKKYGVDDFPQQCPSCAAPKASDYVKGYHGWTCGSFSGAHHGMSPCKIAFHQSTECAVSHWNKRALGAEMMLGRALEDARADVGRNENF